MTLAEHLALTSAVRRALAHGPLSFGDLFDQVADELPGVNATDLDEVLTEVMDQRSALDEGPTQRQLELRM